MRCFSLLLILLVNIFAFGQIVNIENKRFLNDSSGWHGNLDGSFSFVQNQDFLYQLNFRGKIQYKNKKHYFLFLQDFAYSGGKTVYSNSGMGHFRYAYRIKESAWKWESYAQMQYNQILRQRIRSLAGTGIRWKFLNKNNSVAFIGSSVFYEYEEIQPEMLFNSSFRWSSYLSWFVKFKEIQSSGTTYIQPNLTDFKDFRFAGQYAVYSPLHKFIKLKTEFNYFYDSKPPVGVRKSVFSLLFGISVEFGK